MDPLHDDLLESKGGYQAKVSGSYFSDVPMKNIEVVAGYLQLIIDVTNRKKEVDVLGVFKNARIIFSDNYIKETDELWKEHLAATMREPFDGHFEANTQRALKHLPKRSEGDDPANFYNDIQGIKEFLNNLAHLKYNDALRYTNSKYSLGETELSEETFDRVCKELIDRLYGWFVKYCYKET